MPNLKKLSDQLNRNIEPMDDLTGSIEAMGLTIVTRLAGWAASIPNAIMVSRSAIEIFDVPNLVGYTIAVSLELIGHSLVEHWQNARSWNASKRKKDPESNVKLALGLMCGYFIVDVLMVGALAVSDFITNSEGQIFLVMAYPLVGILATVATNERAALFRVKKAIKIVKEDRRRDRTVSEKPSETSDDLSDKARTILGKNADISGAELGRQLGISARRGLRIKGRIQNE